MQLNELLYLSPICDVLTTFVIYLSLWMNLKLLWAPICTVCTAFLLNCWFCSATHSDVICAWNTYLFIAMELPAQREHWIPVLVYVYLKFHLFHCFSITSVVAFVLDLLVPDDRKATNRSASRMTRNYSDSMLKPKDIFLAFLCLTAS